MKPYLKKGWVLVNTSVSPDPETHKIWYDHDIKPDMALYESSRPPNARSCQASKVECFGEFKISMKDEPFREQSEEQFKVSAAQAAEKQKKRDSRRATNPRRVPPIPPFERRTNDARDTRGQITLYINAVQATQQRTRVFAFYVRERYCRLLFHSRSGTLVTPLIDYTTTNDMHTFFWRLTHARKADRGFDTTFEPVDPTDPNSATVRGRLRLQDTDPLFRVSVTDSSSYNDIKYYYVSEPFTSSHTYPVGRGTRCFSAYDLEKNHLFLLKDTWRVANYTAEHETYAKLHANNVPNIPTVLAAGDVPGHWHRCGGDMPHSHFRIHQHFRLVLREVGRPLREFRSTYELVSVISDAFKGMEHLRSAWFYKPVSG